MSRLAGVYSLIAAVFILIAPAVAAQTGGSVTPDYEAWETLADRAEGAIDAGRASDTALEAVRRELVGFREQFLEASSANAARITTLQSQIEALGPAPESGDELAEIADRRAALNRQLQDLRAPGLTAEAAYNRAEGLVREIDRVISDRRANELLQLGASPLNPIHWPEAWTEVADGSRSLRSELRRTWNSDVQRAELQGNLPLILVLTAIGAILLARGRRWADIAGNALRRLGGRGTGVWTLAMSLGRIGLPVLGLYCLTSAAFATGLVGLRSAQLVENIPAWGAVLLILRWLCERLFSKRDDDALIPFAPERRSELRFYGTFLAALFVLRGALAVLLDIENASETAVAVVTYPVMLVAALILFRFGQILLAAPRLTDTDPEGTSGDLSSGFARILKWMGQASILVALITPVLSGIGYARLGDAILYPSILSLALFGFVAVLQRFFADLYGLLSKRGEAGREALVPVLIGFLLVLLSLPILALIWGVRVSELWELWAIFNAGFQLGETRISPTDFLSFVLIFAIGFAITRLFQGALKSSLLPKTRLDTGGQNAIVSGTGYVGIFLAALVAITGAGIDLSSLAIVAGALSVGIGFGLQNIVSNFVSGIILLIERPIAEGDWIEVNGNMGYVRSISVRSTRIETFDRTDVIVPNADFVSGTVTNFTRGNTIGRAIVPVGVAYGTDTRQVEKILREVAESHPMVLAAPPPSVFFRGFGADALEFEIRAILRDVNWVLSVKSDMNHEIAKRFTEAGIEVPFAQRDIWLRNPEALSTGNGGEQET
ncbi:DUF3772 domain-containing protein [Aestuariivita sp.]|uniref:DUF3772 domain-containing protein n=1 Tax=Aestuariivita sp. TaxID=1872407 RepID=UPI00217059BA|nr:DUF3772 domain-containing protein [Aestuariivita sp.]MCE8006738.1 mechanosensitive ion channel family protein [Aestuariivita sp.]